MPSKSFKVFSFGNKRLNLVQLSNWDLALKFLKRCGLAV